MVSIRSLRTIAAAALLALAATPVATSATARRPELVLQMGHSGVVRSIAVSPDGRRFATGSEDHLVKIWDADTGACLWSLTGHPDEVRYLGFGPDGRRLVSVGGVSNAAKDVRVWDAVAGREVLHLSDESGALLTGPNGHDLPFSPDGRWLALPFSERPVLVSLDTTRVVELPGPWRGATGAAWSGDGRKLAVADYGVVAIFDVATLGRVDVPIETADGSDGRSAVALDATGGRLVFVDRAGRVVLWDVAAGREVWRAARGGEGTASGPAPEPLRAVAIRDADGRVVGVARSAALAWDLADGQTRYTIPLAPRRGDVALSPDWRSIAVQTEQPERKAGGPGRPEEMAIWDLRTGSLERKVVGAEVGSEMAIAGEGRLLVAESFEQDPNAFLSGRHFVAWDTESGEARHLSSGRVFPSGVVAWSPDNRSIAVGEMLRVWDLRTGAAFSPPTARPLLQVDFAVTRDLLASAGVFDDMLIVFTKRLPETENSGPSSRVTIPVDVDALTATALVPGRAVATGDRDGHVRTWDVTSGAPLRTLGRAGGEVTSLAFDETGRLLAAGGGDGRVVVWDASDGSEVARLVASRDPVRAVRFAGGALHAVTGDGWLRSWRAGSWSEAGAARVGHDVSAASPRPDAPMIATGDSEGRIRLVDLDAGKATAEVRPSSERVTHVGFLQHRAGAPEFGAVMGYTRTTVAAWTVSTGELVVIPISMQRPVKALAFRPDGRQLATGLQLLDTGSWEAGASTFASYDRRLFAYSPSGDTIACVGTDELRLVDARTGKKIRDMPGVHADDARVVAFGPDGRTVAVASDADANEVRIFRLDGAPPSFALDAPEHSPTALAFGRDGRLVVGSSRGELRVWDVDARRVVASASVPVRAGVESVAVSPDGRTLAVSSGDVVTLWELPSLAPVRTLSGHTNAVGDLAFSPDGRALLSGSDDGTARLWDVASGEHLATLVSALDNFEWLVVTPDGLFDGSPGAWSRIRWRFGDAGQLAPVEAFFADFYTPGLLADLVAGGRPKAKRDIAALDRRQPAVELRLAGGADTKMPASGDVDVEVEVTEAPAGSGAATGSGARDVRLFRNGALVRVWRGDVLSGAKQGRVTLRATVPAVAGENRLTAYAFNRDNVKSPDISLTVTAAATPARPRVARVLVAGVSAYENAAFDLRFAAADAHDFAAETKRRLEATGAFSRVDVVELVDARATRAGILDAIARLTAAGPEDAVLVFFAGHGVARGDRFYLVPHDLGFDGARDRLDDAALARIAVRSISDRDLELALERVDAAHILLVVDACFAGRVLGDPDVRTGPLNSRGLAQLAYEKGMYVLAAAEGYQRAVEASSLGHGVLTYTLVEEGLKRAEADTEPEDGRLLLGEWLAFAARRVPQLHDRLTREAAGASREIVHETTWDTTLQTPRLFYRPRDARAPLVVASYENSERPPRLNPSTQRRGHRPR